MSDNTTAIVTIEANAEIVKQSKQEKEVQAILADTNIKVDAKFQKFLVDMAKLRVKTGTKYAEMIQHVASHYEPDAGKNDGVLWEKRKLGYSMVLKTYLTPYEGSETAPLTVKSAYSTVSRIFTLAKKENAQVIEDLKNGLVTVRETRQITARGGRPEGNESSENGTQASSKSLDEKMKDHLRDAAKQAYKLKLTQADFIALATRIFDVQSTLQASNEAVAKAKQTEAEKAS